MQKGIGLSLFVFLCLINVCFSAQTFSPIHPGSLHVDQLSTLDNNRVNVPDFTVAGFGAAVLDFQSLTSATPVSVTTAGGINFEGETINLSGAGDVTIQTNVNDIPINALNGQFSVTSNSGDSSVVAWGSDISIDSANSNIDLSATSGSVNFEAATFALQGRQSTGGLSLNTQNNGDISIAAGQASNLITGQVNFVSYDLNIDLSSAASITSQSGNVYFSASQDIDVSSAAISVESNSGISTTSDVGSILLEADGAMTFSANTVNFLTSNGQAYSSVTGNIGISATDTSYYQALDAIEVTGVNSGVYVSAYSNIEAVAGNNVVIDSDAEFQVSSYDFTVYSQKDSYIIDTTGNTIMSTTSSVSVTTDGDSQIQADQTVNVQGTSVSFNVGVDTTITTGNTFQITSNTGNPGDVTFDSNNLWIDAIDHVDFGGNSVQIQTESDINFESGLGITMSAANTIAVSASQSGLLEGQSDVTLKSALISDISVGELTIVSGDDTNFESQTINVTLSGSIDETTSDTTFIAGHMLFQSDSSIFLSNEFTAATKNAFALNSSNIIFLANNEFDSTSNTFTGSANNALFLAPRSDFVATTDGKTVFENDMNGVSTTQLVANLLIDVNSGSASFTGDQLTSTQSDSSYFVGTNTFTISAGNYLEISSVAFGLKADGELNFQAGSLELNGVDVYFTANDAFGGDVAFTTNGTVKLDSNAVNGNADRTEIYGYNTLSFSSDNTFSLENTQSGDIKFETSGNYYHENKVGSLYFIANTIVGSGDSGVSLSAPSGPIAISSSLKQDVSFLSGGNFNVDTGDFSLSSNIVAFNGVEGGSIDSAVYNITATGSVAYSSNGYININGTSTVSNTATSTSLGGSENVVIQGGQLTFDVASGVINANGGGARFYSGADISFSTSDTSDSFVVEAYHLNSYVAENGSVSLKSNTGAFSISGGESNYLSGVNSTIELTAAAGAISIATSDNGNFTLYSDHDLIENTAQTLYFNGNPGRNGLVTSTMNDSSICIRSDFNSGETSFSSAKSMNIDSLGDEGLIVMYADYNVAITAVSHSVGILSEGYQTDPQFVLNDTFGILLRTTHDGNGTSSIQLESGSNDISMFARGFFNVTSNDGTIVQSSGGNTDIRTRFYDADILVETWNGNINYAIDEDGYFISGTASIRADTLINATGTQTWSAGTNMIFRQIASIQDPSDSAVVIEGYRGNVTLNAGQETSFTANDGGRIFGEARNGDITLISGGNVAITAETAAVEFEARTAATFTLSDSTSFDASGIAGSMLIATPGGNDITINAGGLISFDSTIGEIDLQVTTGITSVSTDDTILTAPCNHLYGGGSLSIVTGQHILLQTLDNSIYFDANEEFTVDATSVTISGSSVDPIVRVNAGGDTQTPGLSVTSQGDVVFTTQVNIDNSNILTSIISTSNISISASATMNVTSYGDSSSQTNIILQADNSAIDTQTNQFSSLSLTETQITTSSLMNFVSVNSSIDINAVREVRYNAVSMDITVAGGYTGTAIDQIFTSNEGGSISFTAGSGFYAASDSFLGLEAGGDVTLQIGNTLQFSSGRGKANFQADGVMTFTSNDFEFNSVDGTEVAGLNGVSATATTSTSMSSFESTILHAKNDIQYNNVNDFSFTGNTFTSTSGGKLTATVGNDLTLNSYDFLISAANDMDISSVQFNVASPDDQYITFTAGGDFDISSATQGYTSYLNTYFTSNAGIEDEYLDGIEVLSGTLEFTASNTNGVFSLDSASSVLLAVTTSGSLTSTKGSLSFYSSGTNGVYIRGPSLTQTSSTGTNIEAYDGNIGFHGSATLSAVDTILTTSNAYGNIRLYSSSSMSYTSTTSLTIQPPGDPGMYKGYGNITFTSDSITLDPSATIDASSSNKIFVRSLDDMTLAFSVTSFDANRKIQFGGSVSTFESTSVSVTSPETLLDAPIISSTSTTTNSFSSSGALDVIAGGNLVLNAPVLNLQSADDFLFTADGSFISIPSLVLTNIVSDLFGISANVGDISVGITDITAPIVHITSQNGIYLTDKEGTSTIQGGTLNFVSAGDFYLNADAAVSLTSTSGVDISTSGEGNVVIDSYSFTLESTASTVSILARGNLGSIGGRYVLEDNYLDNEGVFHHKGNSGLHWANNFYTRQSININTIAIETTNVNGDLDISSVGTMDIVSHKGNIEFEAIYAVLHHQTTAGLTYFFAQTGNTDYGGYIAGRYNQLFAIQNDYCNDGFTCVGGCSAVDCTNLSNLINTMAYALIDYGLVEAA